MSIVTAPAPRIAYTSYPNSPHGWAKLSDDLSALASRGATPGLCSFVRTICEWNDANGDWVQGDESDEEYVADLIATITGWAKEV